MSQLFAKNGCGEVLPIPSLCEAAKLQLGEILTEAPRMIYNGPQRTKMKSKLAFTVEGPNHEDLRACLMEVLKTGRSQEHILESGNKYGVSKKFHDMNAEIRDFSFKQTSMFQSLSSDNQAKAEKIFEIVFRNRDMRNRNCLHPGMIDAFIISNLLNFPKHIFGFPFACHATDGNESLSLLLYSYRQARASQGIAPLVFYVRDADAEEDETALMYEIQLCAERLGMELVSTLPDAGLEGEGNLKNQLREARVQLETKQARIAVVMTSFENPSLGRVAEWAQESGLELHLHIWDSQWRRVFTSNKKPMHFDLPNGVRTLTIEEGLLTSGYSLYRDVVIRDRHLDVGYHWQTGYMSPNEGGSGASAPLFGDFCMICLGWRALREVAGNGADKRDRSQSSRLRVSKVKRNQTSSISETTFEGILAWAKKTLEKVGKTSSCSSREALEAEMICFQQEFIGGRDREVEGICTGGGTRSINLAFESVLARSRTSGKSAADVKVLTGNPHLAVERAQRRFQFKLVRLVDDGVLCPEKLHTHIGDPTVCAVYTQTLSFTDGITDPLPQIIKIIEAENRKRKASAAPLVTLINDCCLAFSVLVHNASMRVLDMSSSLSLSFDDSPRECVTPIMVTIDAHKHLGCDKGISTVVGTPGTLSCLSGHVKVGAQPRELDLVCALADMHLVGAKSYVTLYTGLGNAIVKVLDTIEEVGMKVVHKRNRVKGSTVVSCEDPSGVMIKKMAKRGHSLAWLFNLAPQDPNRVQTGWQLSLTAYALRDLENTSQSSQSQMKLQSQSPDRLKALDVFLSDLVICHKQVQRSRKLSLLWSLTKEDSFLGYLVGGNINIWMFSQLACPGSGRNFAQWMIRKFFALQLDSGVICSRKRQHPLKTVLKRVQILALVLGIAAYCLIRYRRRVSA